MSASEGSKAGEGLYAVVLAAGASTRFGSAKQLVRVAGRPLGRVTDLQHVLGGVFVIEMEFVYCPSLHAAHARPRREISLDRLIEIIYFGLDTAAA